MTITRVVTLSLCLVAPWTTGCASGLKVHGTVDAHGDARGHEASVKPGINTHYKHPKVETWINRFETDNREVFKQRRRIVTETGAGPGMRVADVGAGTGLFEPLFSEAVGAGGKVIAVDPVPEFIDLIRGRSRAARLYNVQTLRCKEDDALLAPRSVDLVFLCDAYHHLEYPRSTLRSLHQALRPGGELIVLDFERIPGRLSDWILNHVRAGRETVIREVESMGFRLSRNQPDDSFLKENYMIRFRKATPKGLDTGNRKKEVQEGRDEPDRDG